jgi:DNA repair protein RecN (Recombination protein N)
MPKARLGLVEAEGPAGPNGLGRQQLTVRTNPGLPAGPLDEVPSGGEGARLTLALAVALAEADGTPVVVFDEVDAGVGGRLGGIIGAKLRRLAADGRSVIAISHTPQLAAEADTHYLVSKRQEDDTTSVLVEQLQGERRVCEIADMLGGGPAALNQARALLGDAAHEQ